MALQHEYIFVCDDLPKRSFSFFGKNRTEFCDVTFTVGEHSVKAHRIILAAAMPYFHQLFSDQEKKEFPFPDMDCGVLEALIEYAYSCKVKISMENVKMLLSGACMLKVEEVKNACCQFLAERLNLENAFDIRCYSSSLGCSGLVKEIDGFIRKCFSEIMMTENFLNISFTLLSSFISSDELNVKNEKVVFESALKWVKKCPEERREKLPELMKNVRFPFLELSYIKNYVAKEELIRSSALCTDIIQEAIFYKCLPEERKETYSFCITQRCDNSGDQKSSAEENVSICILCQGCVVECFDLVKEKWETRRIHDVPSSISLSNFAVAMDNKMYCFNSDVTHVINLETNRYSNCLGMRHPRIFTRSVSYKNKIFVCGGRENNSLSNIVECFDPKTEEWTEVTPMNTSRSFMAVAVCKEFIYVLGGCTRTHTTTSSVEEYSVETGMWSTSSPMLSERRSFSCCTLNDRIYVCGGLGRKMEDLATAELFDPITKEWKFIASMYAPRCECKMICCLNELYVFGGYGRFDYLHTVEIYDPETDAWRHGESTNEKKTIIGAAVVLLPSI